MRKIPPTFLFILLLLPLACSFNADSPPPPQQQQVSASPNGAEASVQQTPANAEAKPDEELQQRFARIAADAKGRVGVAAVVLETSQAAFLNQNERFPMQSVYKLPIGMAVLRLVDDGKLKLDEKIRVEKSEYVRAGMHSPLRDRNPHGGAEATVSELLRLSVSESDGTASDVLFRLAGGAEAIGEFLNGIGVKDLVVADPEKAIGRDWETQYRNYSTPAGAITLLRALHERRGLSESSQTLMLKFLFEATTGPRRLKGLLPKGGGTVAHKTGTSGTRDGITAATNDIGLITLPNGRHLAIAVFVSDSPADEATREGVIAKIAEAAWTRWGNEK